VDWLALSLLILFCMVGFCAIFFTTFGTLIILAGALLYGFLTGFSVLTPQVLLGLGGLYLLGEFVEFLATIWVAKRMGASNVSIACALIGGMLGGGGGLLAGGAGVMLGAFLGLFLGGVFGEWFVRKNWRYALEAGVGSVLGRIVAVAFKVGVAVGMVAWMGVRIATNLSGRFS